MSDYLLELHDIEAGYGRAALVLRGLTVKVPAGSVVCLVGPNGAGKSTVLKVASGLLAPRSGSIVVDGEDVTGRGPQQMLASGLAHVLQGHSVFREMTVEENVMLGAFTVRNKAKVAERVDFVVVAGDVFDRPDEFDPDRSVSFFNHPFAVMAQLDPDRVPASVARRRAGELVPFGSDGREDVDERGVVEGPGRTVVHNEDEYLTDYFGRRAVEYVTRAARSDQPYFLMLTPNAAHTPLMATQKYYDRFPQIADDRMRTYAAMISALDDMVGGVLDAVDASGEADNTIVFFLTDNGCAAYIPGICSCEPLRGGKLSHYEGGVRVPMMVRWPAKLKPGQVNREVVSSLDIFPTVLAAASAPTARPRLGRRLPKAFDPLPQSGQAQSFWPYLLRIKAGPFILDLHNDRSILKGLAHLLPDPAAVTKAVI